MKREQLVLVKVTFRDETGSAKYRIGTGYFVAADLVLTSNHVFPAFTYESVKIRVEEGGKWLEAESKPCWQSAPLDASLIKTKTRVNIASPIRWQYAQPENNEHLSWSSYGYPEAGKGVNEEGEEYYTTKGLRGIWNSFGGRGQVKITGLDLEVNAPPSNPKEWSGISGAPVFVEDSTGEDLLIGIIKSVPTSFKDRLEGIPSYELLKDADFRAAIEDNNFALPANENWALLVVSENPNEDNFTDPVQAALSESLDPGAQVISANINNILENPGTLLNFIKLICKAPIMVIDATGFQPGIMMVTGIRAVIRRGLTIVATTKAIKEKDLSSLPFNIQEIKLVSLHRDSYQQRNSLPAKDRLKIAIREGKAQLKINPDYLDLPAFDAVRNPVIVDIPAINKKVLFLCPFNEEYNESFMFIRDKIVNSGGKLTENIVRMLDISSPQLVGQSLYEHIRWSNTCIIDWTGWLPNIFYELGVRVAASDIGPVNLIALTEEENLNISLSNSESGSKQKQLLLKLFEPYKYDISKDEFAVSVKNYLGETIIKGKENLKNPEVTLSKLYHNNIYYTAEKYFDWQQENISTPPHQKIKRQMEREFGKDIQASGRYNILFSSNDGFKGAIENQIRENWLCAWFYLSNRYPTEEFKTDDKKKDELISLGESVMEALNLESFKSLKDKIFTTIYELEIPYVISDFESLVNAVQDLKKKAKNRRDPDKLDAALKYMQRAIKDTGEFLDQHPGLAENETNEINTQLADCYGILGGIYRRRGLQQTDADLRKKNFESSYTSYDKGYELEEKGLVSNSYNMLNRLISRIFYDPGSLNLEIQKTDEERFLVTELKAAEEVIQLQLKTNRRRDIWALADLALVKVLLNEEDPIAAFSGFIDESPPAYAYASLLSTLKPLSELNIDIQKNLIMVINFLEKKIS